MKRKLLMAIAVGTFAASALPAAALEDIRAPLSPSGGQSERTGGASISSANDDAGGFVMSAASVGFPLVPQVFVPDPALEDARGPLSPSGSDS